MPNSPHTLWTQHITNAEVSARSGLHCCEIHQKKSSVFGHIVRLTWGSSTQCPILSSWPGIQLFIWSGLEISSSCSLDRLTLQWHWICLLTSRDRPFCGGHWRPWAGYAMTTTMATSMVDTAWL